MILVIEDLAQWRKIRHGEAFENRSVGFVPTMGNLHAGHCSLIRHSRRENDLVVLSIFVNATQFDDRKDLENYPSTFEVDLETAEASKVDYVLHPSFAEMYADHYVYRVNESSLSQVLCGKHRPGHFEGVLTVVMKLLSLVRPDRCYFGEKDFQQLQLIRGMVEAFFLDTQLIACPTVRDEDGLALSSRNRQLSPRERQIAKNFPRILSQRAPVREIVRRLRQGGFEVEYVEDRLGRRFGAVRLGTTRLIDNFPLEFLSDPAESENHP